MNRITDNIFSVRGGGEEGEDDAGAKVVRREREAEAGATVGKVRGLAGEGETEAGIKVERVGWVGEGEAEAGATVVMV
jgi:hypothetical protein